MEKIKVERKYVLTSIKSISENELFSGCELFRKTIKAMVCPSFKNEDTSAVPSPKQYEYAKEAIECIVKGELSDALWKIYHFAEADEENASETLTPMEGWMLCMLLETFSQRLDEGMKI